ncbi:hypothetical protein Tco_1206098, partial [Tanacetum coccineum]
MDREGEGDQYVDLRGTVQVPGCSPIRIQDLQELHVWNRNSDDYKWYLFHARRLFMAT